MRYYIQKENLRTRIPGAIVTADTESYEIPGQTTPTTRTYPLRFGHARYCRLDGGKPSRRDCLDFTDALVFWDWLRSKMDRRRTLWLWCHNLGWDLTVLRFWRELEGKRFTLVGPMRRKRNRETGEWETAPTPGHLITDDPPTALRCWDARGACLRGCDTFNWFASSLAHLGEDLRLEKLPVDPVKATDAELRPYCIRDVEITEAAVLALCRFVKGNDLGNIRYTPAAQAYQAWLHVECPRRTEPHYDPVQTKWERQSYYGGKRYCFYQGTVMDPALFELQADERRRVRQPVEFTGPVTALDLTAAYPAVMQANAFPVRYVRTERYLRPGRALELLRDFGGLASVLVESADEPYPSRTKERLLWATGRFQTALAGPELIRALKAGHVQEVFELALYQMAKPFGPVVTRFLDIEARAKASGDEMGRSLAKRMRNALYGKFAERQKGWNVAPDLVPHEPWGTYTSTIDDEPGFEWRRSIAWQVQRRSDGECTKCTFVPVAAYVTSYARERMRALTEKAGRRGVYYLDSDTLHVSKSGLQALQWAGEIDPDIPGKLRVTGSAQTVTYAAPLHYRWDDTLVLGGVPKRAVELPGGGYVLDKFHRLDFYLQKAPPDGGIVAREVIEVPKHFLGARKGNDGWTRPLAL